MKAWEIIAFSSSIASLFCGFFEPTAENIPPFCVDFPRRLVLLSDLDDLRHARIGAQGGLTQKFAVQVKLLFEFLGQGRTLLVAGHHIGDNHDQKLGAILLQGVAAKQPAEARNLS